MESQVMKKDGARVGRDRNFSALDPSVQESAIVLDSVGGSKLNRYGLVTQLDKRRIERPERPAHLERIGNRNAVRSKLRKSKQKPCERRSHRDHGTWIALKSDGSFRRELGMPFAAMATKVEETATKTTWTRFVELHSRLSLPSI